MIRTSLFYLLSALTLCSAYFVVTARNLFRCTIGLITLLLGIAGVYLLIDAQFLSAVQITVYIGGVVVLIVYVVLLVADVTQRSFVGGSGWRRATVAALAALLCGLLLSALWSHDFSSGNPPEPRSASVAEIGTALLSPERGGFVLAFEIISLVLIAAIVGAITIARSGETGNESNERKS